MIRTGDVLANAAVETDTAGWTRLLAILILSVGSEAGWPLIVLSLGTLVWDLFRHRLARRRIHSDLVLDPPFVDPPARGGAPTLTAATWLHAAPTADVAVGEILDGDVIVWRQPEAAAWLAVFRTPMALCAFFATSKLLWTVLLMYGLGPLEALALGTDDRPYLLIGALGIGLLTPFVAGWGVQRLLSIPLRRRVRREYHLVLRGRDALLVDDRQRDRFRLDDVTRIDTQRDAVGLALLDGRTLTIRTSVPHTLAAVLQDRVGPVAATEVPEDVRRLAAIRAPETSR